MWRADIAEARRGIRSVSGTAESLKNVATPMEALMLLHRRMQDAGFPMADGELDLVFVRKCRADLSGRIAQVGAGMERLSLAFPHVTDRPRLVHRLTNLTEERTQLVEALGAAEARRVTAEEARRKVAVALRGLREKSARTRAEAEALGWIQVTHPRYTELLNAESRRAEAAAQASATLVRLRDRQIQLTGELRAKEKAASHLAARCDRDSAAVSALKDLALRVERWRLDAKEIGDLRPVRRKLSVALPIFGARRRRLS